MRFVGHCCVVVGLFVCVLSSPAPLEGATIPIPLGALSPGSNPFSGTFTNDNDVAELPFSLTEAALVTPEMTGLVCADPNNCDTTTLGFIPILTLFDSALTKLEEVTFASGFPIPTFNLGAGNYVLKLTQYNNYLLPDGSGFEWDDPANWPDGFTKFLFDSDDQAPCDSFVAFNFELGEPECRSGRFAGALNVAVEQVPEPGMLSFVALTTSIALLRRRGKNAGHRHRPGRRRR